MITQPANAIEAEYAAMRIEAARLKEAERLAKEISELTAQVVRLRALADRL